MWLRPYCVSVPRFTRYCNTSCCSCFPSLSYRCSSFCRGRKTFLTMLVRLIFSVHLCARTHIYNIGTHTHNSVTKVRKKDEINRKFLKKNTISDRKKEICNKGKCSNMTSGAVIAGTEAGVRLICIKAKSVVFSSFAHLLQPLVLRRKSDCLRYQMSTNVKF